MKLLEDAGCRVHVPAQSCCGQPAYNSGDNDSARAIAARAIAAFDGFDYVVAPSGSCAGMIKEHYPALFEGDAEMAARAHDLAGRTHELVSFLADVRGVESVAAAHDGAVTYHDSCSSLREMGVRSRAASSYWARVSRTTPTTCRPRSQPGAEPRPACAPRSPTPASSPAR